MSTQQTPVSTNHPNAARFSHQTYLVRKKFWQFFGARPRQEEVLLNRDPQFAGGEASRHVRQRVSGGLAGIGDRPGIGPGGGVAWDTAAEAVKEAVVPLQGELAGEKVRGDRWEAAWREERAARTRAEGLSKWRLVIGGLGLLFSAGVALGASAF